MPVSFTLAKPILARSNDASTTTIPSGSIVEILQPSAGDTVEVEWECGVYSLSLSSLLRACRDDAAGA